MLEKTPESALDSKEIKPVNLKEDQPWIFSGRTDAEAPVFWSSDANMTRWKSPWCWERLRAKGENGVRGWDGWTASLMQWTWTWANSGIRWGTGKPGVLQYMGLQSRTQLGDWTTTTCKIDSQWKFAVWLRELKLGLYNNLEGWEMVGGKFKREGIYVHL